MHPEVIDREAGSWWYLGISRMLKVKLCLLSRAPVVPDVILAVLLLQHIISSFFFFFNKDCHAFCIFLKTCWALLPTVINFQNTKATI